MRGVPDKPVVGLVGVVDPSESGDLERNEKGNNIPPFLPKPWWRELSGRSSPHIAFVSPNLIEMQPRAEEFNSPRQHGMQQNLNCSIGFQR
jgi:hypothetical protein